MADIVSPEKRSKMMAGIRGKDTKPEIAVRKMLHKAGFRFRLHRKDLPGRPDIVLPRYGAAMLINGCFWHGHEYCSLFKVPSSRVEFWNGKIAGNRARDARNISSLGVLGWRVVVIWECAIKGRGKLSADELLDRVATWLTSGDQQMEIRGMK